MGRALRPQLQLRPRPPPRPRPRTSTSIPTAPHARAFSTPNLRTTCTDALVAPTDQPTDQTKPICKAQSEEEKAKADALLDVGEDEAEAVQKQLDDEAAAKKKADEAAAPAAAAPAEKAP